MISTARQIYTANGECRQRDANTTLSMRQYPPSHNMCITFFAQKNATCAFENQIVLVKINVLLVLWFKKMHFVRCHTLHCSVERERRFD